MLELARGAGTTDIVATPHANARYLFNPELIDERIADLSAHVAGAVRIVGHDHQHERLGRFS